MNVDVGHDHFYSLDDPEAEFSVHCMEGSGPGRLQKRTGSYKRKVEPPFSFLYEWFIGPVTW